MKKTNGEIKYTFGLLLLFIVSGFILICPYISLSAFIPEFINNIVRIFLILLFLFFAVLLYFYHIQLIPFHADQCYSSEIFINRYKFFKRCYQISFILFIISVVLYLFTLFNA